MSANASHYLGALKRFPVLEPEEDFILAER